jgi:adenylylsulfate reductase subunit A
MNVMGSHATGCGAWCSGPEDISGGIPEYFWGYNRMMTVDGLFGAGDAVGGTPHAFSEMKAWLRKQVGIGLCEKC